MNRIITRIGLTLATTALLSACGWHLRGVGMIPPGLDSLHIGGTLEATHPLVRDLTQSLDAADIDVPRDSADAQYSLKILDYRSTTRAATVNANARISEQQLTEEVDFAILDRAGDTVLPRTTVTAERVFEYDEDNALATQDERELIRSEMRRNLVSQMLDRLRQLKQG